MAAGVAAEVAVVAAAEVAAEVAVVAAAVHPLQSTGPQLTLAVWWWVEAHTARQHPATNPALSCRLLGVQSSGAEFFCAHFVRTVVTCSGHVCAHLHHMYMWCCMSVAGRVYGNSELPGD